MNDSNTKHFFCTQDAIKYGIDIALLLQHIKYWIDFNKDKESHFHKNKIWFYQSAREMSEYLPFMNEKKIFRLLKKMEDKGLIESGNFNKKQYDRTKWYSLNEHSNSYNQEIHSPKMSNATTTNEQPIPNIKRDIKKDNYNQTLFDKCFKLYQRGNRANALKQWKKLTDEQHLEIERALPEYTRWTEYIYRRSFENYLNRDNEHWKDKVIRPAPKQISNGMMI